MNSYHYDRERSTLRECVALLRKLGCALTVDEIAAKIKFSVQACRNALNVAIKDGYICHGDEKRKCCDGGGNLKLTYRWSGVPIPPPRPVTEHTKKTRARSARQRAELEASKATNFQPWRHPQDEWLFGPAPRVWSNGGKVEARVYRQPMPFDNGKDV
jgi:hypothetical protein